MKRSGAAETGLSQLSEGKRSTRGFGGPEHRREVISGPCAGCCGTRPSENSQGLVHLRNQVEEQKRHRNQDHPDDAFCSAPLLVGAIVVRTVIVGSFDSLSM